MSNTNKELSLCERNSVDMLNFLRVAATLFVFLLHGRSDVVGIDESFWLFAMITNLPAWSGVWILFFLSGYLLQKGFLKNRYPVLQEGKLQPKELFRFYLKRFMKIAPAYYIYLLLFVVLRADDYFFAAPLTALKIFTFTFNGTGGISGIGHLWYISVAMWLYVLAPFFYYLISKIKTSKALTTVFCLTALAGVCLRAIIPLTGLSWYDFNYTFLPCNIDLFFGGMLACTLTEKVFSQTDAKRRSVFKVISLTTFILAVLFNIYIYWKEIYVVYRYVMPTVYILSCSFLLWAYDSEKIKRTKPTWKAIKANPLRLIDAFSPTTYAFYIFHISTFRFMLSALALWPKYAELSVYLRYTIYMGACFLISLVLGIFFTKMISVFGAKKKSTVVSVTDKQ